MARLFYPKKGLGIIKNGMLVQKFRVLKEVPKELLLGKEERRGILLIITKHLPGLNNQNNSMKKEIILEGNNFSNEKELYDEVESKFTKGLEWKIGRNLNAFNDVLRGGFGIYEYEEPVKVIWKNFEK